VFLYSKLIVGRASKPALSPIMGLSYHLEDYEFIGVITSDYGCYRPIAFAI